MTKPTPYPHGNHFTIQSSVMQIEAEYENSYTTKS